MANSPRWTIEIERSAAKVLLRPLRDLTQRIQAAVGSLAENPRPAGCKKLAGCDGLYRLRVGNWRIVYIVENRRLLVVMAKLSPRTSAYRDQ